MQLLRASNMKAVRLQLALVSNNRKAALEAIDGLIDLDSEIASFIADMPPVPVSVNELREIAGWIDEQRTAIASEILVRSEEHTSELQSLMRISYAVFCLKKKTTIKSP